MWPWHSNPKTRSPVLIHATIRLEGMDRLLAILEKQAGGVSKEDLLRIKAASSEVRTKLQEQQENRDAD